MLRDNMLQMYFIWHRFCVWTVNNLKVTSQIGKKIDGVNQNPFGGRRGMSLRRGWGVKAIKWGGPRGVKTLCLTCKDRPASWNSFWLCCLPGFPSLLQAHMQQSTRDTGHRGPSIVSNLTGWGHTKRRRAPDWKAIRFPPRYETK